MTVGYQISLWTNPWGITWFEVGTRYICGLARHSASYWVHAMSDVGIPEFTVHGISILQLQPVVGAVQILVVTGRRLSYSSASSTRVRVTVSRYRRVDPSGCTSMMVRVSTERSLSRLPSGVRGPFLPSVL